MGYGVWLNDQAEETLRAQFIEQGHSEVEVRTYPTLFPPYLRRAVARVDGEIWVGLHTPLGGGASEWESFVPPPPHPLIERLRATREGTIFEWFAMNQTTARVMPTAQGTRVEIDDLRYGFPGRPERGMWGIRGEFNEQGELISPVRRIRAGGPRGLSLEAFWKASFGDLGAVTP